MALALLLLAAGVGTSSARSATGDSCSFSVGLTATPATGPSPLVVQLNATVTAGTPTQFDWSFGDGSFWNSSGAASGAPLHRYATPGQFVATVSVLEASCRATGSVTVVTTPSPLTVSLSASSHTGDPPLTVLFSATISGGTGTYASAFWSFGDGGVGSGLPVSYTYQAAGTFHVVVNVTDSGGHWALADTVVTVRTGSAAGASEWFGIDAWIFEVGAAAAFALAVGAGVLRIARRRPAQRTSSLLPAAENSGGPSSMSEPTRPATHETPGNAAAGVIVEGSTTASELLPQSRASRAGGGERVQLTQRVILHIGAQGRQTADEVGPVALTQAGMARGLEVTQNSLTNVLRRLVAAGVLQQDVRHVSGQPRRLRVYRFTDRGEAVYRDLRSRSRTESTAGQGSSGPGPPTRSG
ncbi:MAG: PKD domain-containing protein [Thermoplasmata archaeon]|nr:PKD domain-containing protein [Thermoplasmata archaeon]MCI4355741.1 PKD domain-containing protein [Thermoplasmata archaeon]